MCILTAVKRDLIIQGSDQINLELCNLTNLTYCKELENPSLVLKALEGDTTYSRCKYNFPFSVLSGELLPFCTDLQIPLYRKRSTFGRKKLNWETIKCSIFELC